MPLAICCSGGETSILTRCDTLLRQMSFCYLNEVEALERARPEFKCESSGSHDFVTRIDWDNYFVKWLSIFHLFSSFLYLEMQSIIYFLKMEEHQKFTWYQENQKSFRPCSLPFDFFVTAQLPFLRQGGTILVIFNMK